MEVPFSVQPGIWDQPTLEHPQPPAPCVPHTASISHLHLLNTGHKITVSALFSSLLKLRFCFLKAKFRFAAKLRRKIQSSHTCPTTHTACPLARRSHQRCLVPVSQIPQFMLGCSSGQPQFPVCLDKCTVMCTTIVVSHVAFHCPKARCAPPGHLPRQPLIFYCPQHFAFSDCFC